LQKEAIDEPGVAVPEERSGRWTSLYRSPWAMVAAGYVFPPLGLYMMWRFRSWPVWVKGGITVFGSAAAIFFTYVSTSYIWPRVL
jgi:hypothetical protein